MEQVLVLGLVLVVDSLISGVEPCPPLKRETCNEIDGEREKGREVEERGEKGEGKRGTFRVLVSRSVLLLFFRCWVFCILFFGEVGGGPLFSIQTGSAPN